MEVSNLPSQPLVPEVMPMNDHPLTSSSGLTPEQKEAIEKVKNFITTYGPYITIGLFVFRFYTNFKLNRTLTAISKKLHV